jgi:aspartyl-tRNA synthetase
MLLTKQESIRDVMAFPKNQNAECLVSDAPNTVDQEQLDELGISIRNE